ncbi:fibrillarin-like rRNA/tRNA 2'-O-methyltransferase [Candidatus Micrarchaeota archaeon]|nr:fibrillarin-like rRNA/tRNA 2'-O-methyltransferase [Candidatus Micrarchaeota archaeon]
MKSNYPNVYFAGDYFATVNMNPGVKVYTEKLVRDGPLELRTWDAFKSKLCGAMKKGLKTFPFGLGSKVLYLGASTGTTVSHLSDVVGRDGEIYAVEFSPQCLKSLLPLSESRSNIIPIHADARNPSEYAEVGAVDVVYQDVAQPDQDQILIKNAKMFLKPGGIAMICIKSQSIDVTKRPDEIFIQVLETLSGTFEIVEKLKLEPFDKDHLFVVCRLRT